MRTVYVLVYMQKTAGPDGKEFMTPTPYAVFEDSITAEKMKRDGDEIIRVPFFEDPTERTLQAIGRYKEEKPQLMEQPWKVTYSGGNERWNKDSTMAPPDYNTYPRVTCNKTVDEHTWRDRSD